MYGFCRIIASTLNQLLIGLSFLMLFIQNYDSIIVNLELAKIIDFSAVLQKEAMKLFCRHTL